MASLSEKSDPLASARARIRERLTDDVIWKLRLHAGDPTFNMETRQAAMRDVLADAIAPLLVETERRDVDQLTLIAMAQNATARAEAAEARADALQRERDEARELHRCGPLVCPFEARAEAEQQRADALAADLEYEKRSVACLEAGLAEWKREAVELRAELAALRDTLSGLAHSGLCASIGGSACDCWKREVATLREGPGTCATCQHWDGEHTRAQCVNPLRHKFISLSIAFETRRDFGCSLHEPLPLPPVPTTEEEG